LLRDCLEALGLVLIQGILCIREGVGLDIIKAIGKDHSVLQGVDRTSASAGEKLCGEGDTISPSLRAQYNTFIGHRPAF
jgi:hypothetical protein